MDHLSQLEQNSVYILREAYSNLKGLAMLWSIGKDSTVLLWLTRKAFFGHVPFPLIHIDTSYKIPEMIEFRDRAVQEWKLDMIFARNDDALEKKNTFPHGNADRLVCCHVLKTLPLSGIIDNTIKRYRFNHALGQYDVDQRNEQFTGLILGVRADEEGTRSKERYFSPRDKGNIWEIASQPPEFWNQYNTDFPPGTHVRIHPLLDWTELDIWEYIEREQIPTVSLYYNHGDGTRYRSLGCYPCTFPIKSEARNAREIIAELREGQLVNIAERSGRAQDKDGGGGLEKLRRDGYM